MKTLWICGLLSVLSIVAYSRISVAVSGAGEPFAAATLTEYVFLHETRNASIPLQVVAHTNVCR